MMSDNANIVKTIYCKNIIVDLQCTLFPNL